jgi:hypothetical protein
MDSSPATAEGRSEIHSKLKTRPWGFRGPLNSTYAGYGLVQVFTYDYLFAPNRALEIE